MTINYKHVLQMDYLKQVFNQECFLMNVLYSTGWYF